jgi:hypothetical protein
MVQILEFMSLTTGKLYYFDPKTGLTRWNSIKTTPSNVIINSPWKLVYSRNNNNNPYYYNTKTGISQWTIPKSVDISSPLKMQVDCKKISGLRNIHNSCYIDSVLQALFVSPNIFSDELLTCDLSNDTRYNICNKDTNTSIRYRQAIQKELRKISQTILGTAASNTLNVTNLRSLIKKCPVNQKFYGHGQHDSGEFLTYLLNFFPISETATTRVITWGTNNVTDKTVPITDLSKPSIVIDKKSSVVTSVDPFTLLGQDTSIATYIFEYLHEYNDSILDEYYIVDGVGYSRRISEKVLISSPIIIINLNRRNPLNGALIEVPVIPNISVEITEQNFVFSAVVVYEGNHYVCYYKCGDIWYLYNDISSRLISRVGSYDDLLESTNIITNGVTFYYNML